MRATLLAAVRGGGRRLQVRDKPYSKFRAIMTKGMSFYITIDGHLFEIPYEFWWQVGRRRWPLWPPPFLFVCRSSSRGASRDLPAACREGVGQVGGRGLDR